LSFRASGVVVVARTPDGGTIAGSPPSAGFAIDVDRLVTIAALSPEPKLEEASAGAAGTGSSTP
jgi:hypothetical protein